MTVAREAPYLHATLESMSPEFPVNLVVGSRESAYVARYEPDARFNLELPSREAWQEFEACHVFQRACWNYWRCLTLGVPDEAGVVIFEDDLRFARNWHRRFLETVEEIRGTHPEFMLSLYTAYDFTTRPYLEGKHFVPFPEDLRFYGTQGVYFTPLARKRFIQALNDMGVRKFMLAYDMILHLFIHTSGLPMFVTCPSLIEHQGALSTGLAQHHHTAGCFLEELP